MVKRKVSEPYKMSKDYLKGKVRRRGEPILYDEVKESWNLKATPYAKAIVKKAAKSLHFSSSELIERWARTELSKSGILLCVELSHEALQVIDNLSNREIWLKKIIETAAVEELLEKSNNDINC